MSWSFLIIQKRSLQRLTYFIHVLRESKHVSCHLCHDLISAYFYPVLSDSLKGQFQIEPWLQEGRVRGLRFFVDPRTGWYSAHYWTAVWYSFVIEEWKSQPPVISGTCSVYFDEFLCIARQVRGKGKWSRHAHSNISNCGRQGEDVLCNSEAKLVMKGTREKSLSLLSAQQAPRFYYCGLLLVKLESL